MAIKSKIDCVQIGASLSNRACRQFDVDIFDCMIWLANDLGVKRLRLMSYWDEHEKQPGQYDFSELIAQLDLAQSLGCEVTLCLGLRQPRWPETHRPDWAKDLKDQELEDTTVKFLRKTLEAVDRFSVISSYQLENEALNKGIGHGHDFSRQRLRSEMKLIKDISDKPVVMSLSNSWGLPIFGPIPDTFAVSIYPYQWTEKGRSDSRVKPWMIRLRAAIIRLLWRREVFCHELQMEPWGDKSVDHMTNTEQLALMNPQIMQQHLEFALRCNIKTIDLWGAEWWYYRSKIDAAFEKEIKAVLLTGNQ